MNIEQNKCSKIKAEARWRDLVHYADAVFLNNRALLTAQGLRQEPDAN